MKTAKLKTHSNSLEQPHTQTTDEILKVIDTGDTNRYAVALRLTTYVEEAVRLGRIAELKLILSFPSMIDLENRLKELSSSASQNAKHPTQNRSKI